jgi:hypothetical protein
MPDLGELVASTGEVTYHCPRDDSPWVPSASGTGTTLMKRPRVSPGRYLVVGIEEGELAVHLPI